MSSMKRYKFNDIFEQASPTQLRTKVRLDVNGFLFNENDIFTNTATSSGGINFFLFKDYDIEAEEKGEGILIIQRFIKDESS